MIQHFKMNVINSIDYGRYLTANKYINRVEISTPLHSFELTVPVFVVIRPSEQAVQS